MNLCSTCQHWAPSDDRETGQCHRSAPRAVLSDEIERQARYWVRWPTTDAADGCGEWQSHGVTPDIYESASKWRTEPLTATSILAGAFMAKATGHDYCSHASCRPEGLQGPVHAWPCTR